MSAEARARLAARTAADYIYGGHRGVFVPDLNDVAAVANEAALNGNSAVQSAGAAAATLAAALAIFNGGQGFGLDPLDLSLNSQLGSGAFTDAAVLRGRFPIAANASRQLLPQDWGRDYITESGTATYTLPLLADLWDCPGWWVGGWNRSGNTLTIQRSASPDVIGGAATSFTVADGAGWRVAYRNSARFERVA